MRAFSTIALLLAAGCQRAAEPVRGTLELIAAPAGAKDAAPVVARELVRAHTEGKDLLVYVGASWCEPCTHFHDAAAAGKLDDAFPRLRLLVFDADRDHDALDHAGYSSDFIPLFAVPGADGRATARHIEGSVKGDGAVAEITPRLRALLDGGSGDVK